MRVNKFRILLESAIVIYLWIIACLMMGFNMDYPFQGVVLYLLGFLNFAALLYPLVYIVGLFRQIREGDRLDKKSLLMARYFHYFYLVGVVVFAHLASELSRRWS